MRLLAIFIFSLEKCPKCVLRSSKISLIMILELHVEENEKNNNYKSKEPVLVLGQINVIHSCILQRNNI